MATNYGNLKQVQWWKTNQEIRCWCMWIITCKGTIRLMYTFCSLWRLLRHKYHWKLMLKSPKPDLSIKLCSRHQHNSKKRTICFQCNVNWLLFWAHLVMKWGWLITLGGGGTNTGAKDHFSAVAKADQTTGIPVMFLFQMLSGSNGKCQDMRTLQRQVQ